MGPLTRQRAIQASAGDLVIYNCQLNNANEHYLAIVTRVVDKPCFCGFEIRNCRSGSTSNISFISVSHIIPGRYVPRYVLTLFDFRRCDIAQARLSDHDVCALLEHASSLAAASIQRAVKQRFYAFPNGALFRRLASKYADHDGFCKATGSTHGEPVCG